MITVHCEHYLSSCMGCFVLHQVAHVCFSLFDFEHDAASMHVWYLTHAHWQLLEVDSTHRWSVSYTCITIYSLAVL